MATNGKRKWLFLGLGIITAGLSLFGYHYWKKNKQVTDNDSNAPEFKAQKPKATAKTSAQPATKSAAKGTTKKSSTKASGKGPNTPPEGSAKTAPVSKPIDAKTVAKNIHTSVLKKDFTKVYEQLRNLKNTKDYSAVNNVFKTLFVAGVRRTLVDGLLTTFKDSKQRDTLNKSFRAMGLKYNDKSKQWALSGVDQSLIITVNPTKVWKDPKTAVAVPASMVLGLQVCQRGNFTLFENDKQYFLVETKYIKPYHS